MPTPAIHMELDPLRLMTVEGAAAATGLDMRTLRHLIATRRIPVVRLSRSVRIRRTDLEAVIAAATAPIEEVAA